MIGVVFSYQTAHPGEFERVYGPNGEWAEFFSAGAGYLGSQLLRDLEQPGRYLVIDRWESAEDYNAFIEAHRTEYMERVDDNAFLYDQELQLGAFEAVE